jgi:lysophospholipase L1-like esterase
MGKTIFVIGDSTTGLNPPSKRTGDKVSWADVFIGHINPVHTSYQNRAIPGYSSRDYLHRGALDKVLVETKHGDILLVCHGHIEGTPLIRDNERTRGCLPGAGEEIEIVYDAFFKREETVHTFGWYLRACHARCQQHGVQPVFISPPVRNVWQNGLICRTKSTGYAETMREVCQSMDANFFDFGAISAMFLNKIGQSSTSHFYLPDDTTHTNGHGAKVFASLLAASLIETFPLIFSQMLYPAADSK